MAELQYHERAGFCTWTYAELPANASLCKRDLQLALKRLRKQVAPHRVRYYACGEYGEDKHRPHYHGIVFGLDWRDRKVVDETWGLGRTSVGTVTADSVLYVCDYATKSVLGKGAAAEYDETGRERPFSVCSLGMGARWCDAHAEGLRRNGLSMGGQRVGVPRYWARRLELPASWANDSQVMAVHEVRAARGEYQDALESLWSSRAQRERTLNQRRDLRQKGKL